MPKLARLDQRFVWHPFTQMRDWLKREPIVIVSGKGAVLRDVRGREYLDANSSIWTNLHGHAHPKINAAIQRQLRKIAHSSALGLANEPATLLAERLVKLANPTIRDLRSTMDAATARGARQSAIANPKLARVFFSDDGSTAMEVALKLAYEFARRTGRSRQPRFLSLQGAYHGDTVGAVSLGHIDLFHKAYAGLLFKSDNVMSPYCYRCPFNRAKPERADARAYRRCNWECVDQVEQRFARRKKRNDPYTAMVVEPLMQGAAGMIPQPPGWLRRVAEMVRGNGAQLIADEVMTGFGRTGVAEGASERLASSSLRHPDSPPCVERGRGIDARPLTPALSPSDGERVPAGRVRGISSGSVQLHAAGILSLPGKSAHRPRSHERGHAASLFACHREGVQPDFLALAKGLTGGYLPMAATLTTPAVFDAFLGEYEDFKTFFHGHSYTGNQLGAAAALASLDLLQAPASLRQRQRLEQTLREQLQTLWELPNVGDIRQVGLIAGVELVRDWRTREPFDLRERAGIRVCEAMARRGVLTRPVGNVIVLIPPYCTTPGQVGEMVHALHAAVREVLG